jgi:hypothetical protein
MKSITEIIGGAQVLLDVNFDLQTCFEETLTDEYRTFIQILRVVEGFLPPLIRPYAGKGRKPLAYTGFMRSELAKRYFHIEKTNCLILRLKNDPSLRLICGFEKVPGKATFSRNFAYLAGLELTGPCLDAIVKDAFKGEYIQHVNRDSTAIPAREKVIRKEVKKVKKVPKKRGRKPKGTAKEPKEPTVMERQVNQEPEVSLSELNKDCAWGCKKNSQGNVDYWKGYKLHLDVSDNGFPLTAIVTGANVHDSQLAIPMEKLTEKKVLSFYSLMDAGYDAQVIDDFIRSRGRIPIIDTRSISKRPPLDPAKRERFKIRSTVERSNSHLKDNFIPQAIYVKGYQKVSFVLLTAVVCLATLKYLSMRL